MRRPQRPRDEQKIDPLEDQPYALAETQVRCVLEQAALYPLRWKETAKARADARLQVGSHVAIGERKGKRDELAHAGAPPKGVHLGLAVNHAGTLVELSGDARVARIPGEISRLCFQALVLSNRPAHARRLVRNRADPFRALVIGFRNDEKASAREQKIEGEAEVLRVAALLVVADAVGSHMGGADQRLEEPEVDGIGPIALAARDETFAVQAQSGAQQAGIDAQPGDLAGVAVVHRQIVGDEHVLR